MQAPRGWVRNVTSRQRPDVARSTSREKVGGSECNAKHAAFARIESTTTPPPWAHLDLTPETTRDSDNTLNCKEHVLRL